MKREAIQATEAPEDWRIQAILEGKRNAAESLLTELLPRVRNLVRYLSRGDQDVDDITQEALMAILRGLPTWRREGSFKAWSDRVVARTAFAAMKKTRVVREQQQEEDASPEQASSGEAPPDDYVLRRHMVRLLDQLPQDQRQCLVMHHVLEMSVPEMTEELGIPFETVRSRLRLGRARLRELYARESTPAGDDP
jgi:RNA polymerase sigma-70 factor, ECF subfamily